MGSDTFEPNLPVKRDNDILRHTYRMGMTTPQVLHRMFMPSRTINAVSQVTTRLVKDGYLARHRLWHKTMYYTLGNRSVRLLGAPRSKSLPRGEQALPIDLGTLAFCCMGDTVRRRLLPGEVLAQHPWFPRQYLGSPMCFVTDGGLKRLALIHVEMSDYPNHVLRKHQKQVHSFREIPDFASLIDAEGFMLVTVTTTPERREALINEFDRDPWYPPFAVFDYPELCHLL